MRSEPPAPAPRRMTIGLGAGAIVHPLPPGMESLPILNTKSVETSGPAGERIDVDHDAVDTQAVAGVVGERCSLAGEQSRS